VGEQVTYLLSKDPVTERGGDVEMANRMMAMAAESFDVDCICLSGESERVDNLVTRVAKPPVSAVRLLASSVRDRRSLVHSRFDTDSMVGAINRSTSTIFVTEHSYMAESWLRSERSDGSSRLLVSTDVSESLVWGATRGWIGRIERGRILRDELRVARAADGVGAYDLDEVDYYVRNGVGHARWLDITLPPGGPVDPALAPRRLIFFGDRSWPPNQQAVEILLRWWPEISAGIVGAELVIVGRPLATTRTTSHSLPEGVRDLGFVRDLDAVLAGCRGLVAPIMTGGGVRVKILHALRVGLPTVSTSIGLGSLGSIFALVGYDDKEQFVGACRNLLLNPRVAEVEGRRLWSINRDRWVARVPHTTIESWLAGGGS